MIACDNAQVKWTTVIVVILLMVPWFCWYFKCFRMLAWVNGQGWGVHCFSGSMVDRQFTRAYSRICNGDVRGECGGGAVAGGSGKLRRT